MSLDVGSGRYAFRCLFEDTGPMTGPAVTVPGHVKGFPATVPVTYNELVGAGQGVPGLRGGWAEDARRPGRDAGQRPAAGEPDGGAPRLASRAPDVRDAGRGVRRVRRLRRRDRRAGRRTRGRAILRWTGFYRLEYGLWHGQSAAELTPVRQQACGRRAIAAGNVADHGDPADRHRAAHPRDPGERAGVPAHRARRLRQRDHPGHDAGQHQGTRELLSLLHPLLVTRYPGLPAVYTWLDRLQTLLEAEHQPDGTWVPVSQLPAPGAAADRRSVQPGAAGTRADRVHSRAEEHVMGDASRLTRPDLPPPSRRGPRRRSFLRGVAGGVAGGVVGGRRRRVRGARVAARAAMAARPGHP